MENSNLTTVTINLSFSSVLKEAWLRYKSSAHIVLPLGFIYYLLWTIIIIFFPNVFLNQFVGWIVIAALQAQIFTLFKLQQTGLSINIKDYFSKKSTYSQTIAENTKTAFKVYTTTQLTLIPLYLLLFIPGLIFNTFWTFVVYVTIDNKLDKTKFFKVSQTLVKGHWWLTFFINSLFGLFGLLIIIVGLNTKNTAINLVWVPAVYVINSLLTPFFIIMTITLYQKLKSISETNVVPSPPPPTQPLPEILQ